MTISANMTKFYINGAWVEPNSAARMGVENPATEEIVAENAGDAPGAIGRGELEQVAAIVG